MRVEATVHGSGFLRTSVFDGRYRQSNLLCKCQGPIISVAADRVTGLGTWHLAILPFVWQDNSALSLPSIILLGSGCGNRLCPFLHKRADFSNW